MERDYSGGFSRDEMIVVSSDTHRTPDFIIYDEAHHPMFEKRYFDIPVKEWVPDINYGGETPRGTKSSRIGGIKKSKQQRAAIKARRKQR